MINLGQHVVDHISNAVCDFGRQRLACHRKKIESAHIVLVVCPQTQQILIVVVCIANLVSAFHRWIRRVTIQDQQATSHAITTAIKF